MPSRFSRRVEFRVQHPRACSCVRLPQGSILRGLVTGIVGTLAFFLCRCGLAVNAIKKNNTIPLAERSKWRTGKVTLRYGKPVLFRSNPLLRKSCYGKRVFSVAARLLRKSVRKSVRKTGGQIRSELKNNVSLHHPKPLGINE